MTIEFSVDYRTWPGQDVYVCGSLPELGGGDVAGALLMECSPEFRWTAAIEADLKQDVLLTYRYFIKDQDYAAIFEAGGPRVIKLSHQTKVLTLVDQWQSNDDISPLLKAPFRGVVFKNSGQGCLSTRLSQKEVIIRATVPAMTEDDSLYICGNVPALGSWKESNAVKMSAVDSVHWALSLPAGRLGGDTVEYKFIKETAAGMEWEEGWNHKIDIPKLDNASTYAVEHCEVSFRTSRPRFAGTAVPVFSLRSAADSGIGDFGDLKLMIDWAAATGQQFVQLLPVNDTTTACGRLDPNPYNCVSTMALNPAYMNLGSLGRLKDKLEATLFESIFSRFNAQEEVDADKVFRKKDAYMRKVFAEGGRAVLDSAGYKSFAEANAGWLPAYSAFCALREEYDSGNFHKWGDLGAYEPSLPARLYKAGKIRDMMDYYCYVQYNLHLQLAEAHSYATARGVALKCALPYNIQEYSVETWMKSYGYDWLQQRLSRMSVYFDACGIDHISVCCDKLPGLVGNTGMLIGSDEVGVLPDNAGKVLSDLRIPTLEVQRIPKVSGWKWGDPQQYPYCSECMPSTHDTSTIRGWWEEDRAVSELYYHDFLGFSGETPVYCESWIVEGIIRAHLKSSSMLAVIPLQDWFATSVSVRRPGGPDLERINRPGDAARSWRYRMHLSLEELLAKRYFTLHIRQIVSSTRQG